MAFVSLAIGIAGLGLNVFNMVYGINKAAADEKKNEERIEKQETQAEKAAQETMRDNSLTLGDADMESRSAKMGAKKTRQDEAAQTVLSGSLSGSDIRGSRSVGNPVSGALS